MKEVLSGVMTKKDLLIELAKSWKESGIEEGDTVLVHSSLSKFIKNYASKGINISPDDILDVLILCAGEKGTLIFPTYNFEFAKGKPFDLRKSRSETGALTEAARNREGSVRTGHPLFSFAVTGHKKDLFSNLDNFSAFGKDSPFAKLLELDGKIAALDVAGEYCMTFYHHVEEMESAPNRFHKIFKGSYIDSDGYESVREFNVYSRKTDEGVETDVKPMEEYLWSKGLYSGCRPGEGSCLHVIKARTVYEEASAFIRSGNSMGMLYRIEKKKK